MFRKISCNVFQTYDLVHIHQLHQHQTAPILRKRKVHRPSPYHYPYILQETIENAEKYIFVRRSYCILFYLQIFHCTHKRVTWYFLDNALAEIIAFFITCPGAVCKEVACSFPILWIACPLKFRKLAMSVIFTVLEKRYMIITSFTEICSWLFIKLFDLQNKLFQFLRIPMASEQVSPVHPSGHSHKNPLSSDLTVLKHDPPF